MTYYLDRWLGYRPEALLFDLDGTLVDSVPDIAMAIDAMLETLGCAPAGEAVVRQWVGNGAKVLVERALNHAGMRDDRESSAANLRFAHACFLDNYHRENGRASRLYPGVRDALRAWQRQQVSMALVTNKPIQFVPHLLESLGVAEFFTVLLGGECVDLKKPDPQMLLLACEKLRVAPGRALMIGDSRNDVLAAQRAGMPVVAVNYGYNYDRDIALEGPDKVVADLRELH